MGIVDSQDPAIALNLRARTEGWPLSCDSRLEFERPELNALRDIWRALACGNRVPSRADFDARKLKPFLRNITIIERVRVDAAAPRYRVRLTGSGITELNGDNTGKFIDEIYPAETLPRVIVPLAVVLDRRMPLRFMVDFTLPPHDYLTGESFVAPLANAQGEVELVLRCIYFKPRSPGAAR